VIAIEMVLQEIRGLDRRELETFVAQGWVRPDNGQFDEIDVARVRLIVELRNEMAVEDETIPLVLSLLDSLYDARRRLRNLLDAVAAQPEPVRVAIRARLADGERAGN
jgi:chaperone modulatory protein CbpM